MAKWCWVGVSVDAGVQPRYPPDVVRSPGRPLRQSHRPSDLPTFPSDPPTFPSDLPTFPSDPLPRDHSSEKTLARVSFGSTIIVEPPTRTVRPA